MSDRNRLKLWHRDDVFCVSPDLFLINKVLLIYAIDLRMYYFLSHLLIAGCDIGVQISVRPFVRPSVRPSVCPSTFTSTFGFLDIRDSCESETLHSNCPLHTL